ncbi:hypothetical protein [Streptacidiphilus jiangxiensis]|uniref:Uncharacterized protein n=1 Tax=Streptacidiphilus jiangxiensis TaxID=235985 RepID=A0A1H7QMQ0_STRJI|nr:hypothetical protein [Streptacidiphilus jiangxiensis]SEL48914.1 hypothetical protein SAMN05414137_109100 [Streptacidiphilus jiangxiensis]
MMKPTLRGAAATGTAALLVLGLAGTSAGVERAAAGATAWTTAKLPGGYATLLGSAAPDAHTVWVAGAAITDRGPQRLPGFAPVLYAHDTRTGGGWTIVPTAKGVPVRMNAVAAVSDRDGWLVGDQGTGAKGVASGGVYTEHWNGRSWSVQQMAVPARSQGAGLLSVSAVDRTDAWAAGWVQIADPATGGKPATSHDDGLLAHWNGTAWQRVPLPTVGPDWLLNSVTAVSAKDVWAVGVTAQGDREVPVALHYDGHSWTVQRDAAFGGFSGGADGGLLSVTAHDRDDVWAVGSFRAPGSRHNTALIEHWNGRRWNRVAAPAAAGTLTGVAAAPGGVVAVGDSDDAAGDGYALRVRNGRAASLGLPGNTAATQYSPWAVGYYQGTVTVLGVVDKPAQSQPMPMVLTRRG